MSAPALMAVAAAVLCLGMPTVVAAGSLDSKQRASGAADAAALAAADAASGWIDAEPCAVAAQVTNAANVALDECDLDATSGVVRLSVSVQTPLGAAHVRARAGPPAIS